MLRMRQLFLIQVDANFDGHISNLVRVLMTKYHLTLANVHCHNEYANKACPCFKIEDFRNAIFVDEIKKIFQIVL